MLFLLDLDKYEVLISETRWPYVPLDVFASAHLRCIPTIRICHLEEGETEEQIGREMNLSYQEEYISEDDTGRIPKLLRWYQIDPKMRPIIFWHDLDDLKKEIASRLSKMAQSREELLTLSQATRYFLSIGRRPEKVFISNAKSQNKLASKLAGRFYEEGIKRFHYMDINAIPIGTPNWLTKVRQEIDTSKIFIALINQDYLDSKWCR
jgi:hypothetical protein